LLYEVIEDVFEVFKLQIGRQIEGDSPINFGLQLNLKKSKSEQIKSAVTFYFLIKAKFEI